MVIIDCDHRVRLQSAAHDSQCSLPIYRNLGKPIVYRFFFLSEISFTTIFIDRIRVDFIKSGDICSTDSVHVHRPFKVGLADF